MISVIIPVYNVKPYLDDCIQSVIRQDYTDFECILVDDGSTDGSSEICDQWAQKDNRIRVIHQPNGGVSAARNRGLDSAKGEYIAFIDSDDWVDADYLSAMADSLKGKEVDLVVSGLSREFVDGSSIRYVPQYSSTFDLDSNHAEDFVMLNEQSVLYGPYIKLYKNDIIRHHQILFDPQVTYGEDLLFNYLYLEYVRTIACINEIHYHYRTLGSGTLSGKLRPEQFDTDYRQWKVLQSFYQRHNLWSSSAQIYLYKRLWGILYDGIFLYPYIKNASILYLKKILSIPEIDALKLYQKNYHCSKWIKKAILYRCYFLFYFIFKLGRHKTK